jgi:hypothetical protein
VQKSALQKGYGVLASLGIAAIAQLATNTRLDWGLWICIGSFCLAIPFLALLAFAPRPLASIPKWLTLPQAVYTQIEVVAPRLAIIGWSALFWHFAPAFGILFAIAALSAWQIVKWWSDHPDYFTVGE